MNEVKRREQEVAALQEQLDQAKEALVKAREADKVRRGDVVRIWEHEYAICVIDNHIFFVNPEGGSYWTDGVDLEDRQLTRVLNSDILRNTSCGDDFEFLPGSFIYSCGG